jgi:hypothetical protein
MTHCHVVHLPSNNTSISVLKLSALDDKELSARMGKDGSLYLSKDDS